MREISEWRIAVFREVLKADKMEFSIGVAEAEIS
jgi:hypothetical protein